MINLTNLNEGLFKEVAYYWNEDMPMMTMEECGELVKALSKYVEPFSIASSTSKFKSFSPYTVIP